MGIHQNHWRRSERPDQPNARDLRQMTIVQSTTAAAAYSRRARQRYLDQGLVHVRLMLTVPIHAAVCELRDRHHFDSLQSTLNAYLLLAEKHVNIRTLQMPRRHSKDDHMVESNVMITPEARDFLGRIKSTHGLARCYAIEALMDALPNPWAVTSLAPSTTNQQRGDAVSG